MSNRGKHCHQGSGKAAGTQPTGEAAKGQRGQRPGAVILQGLLPPPVPSQLVEKIKQNPPSAGSTRFSGCTLPSLPDSWLRPSLEKQGLLSGFQTTRGRCRGLNLRPRGAGCPGSCHCHPAGATPPSSLLPAHPWKVSVLRPCYTVFPRSHCYLPASGHSTEPTCNGYPGAQVPHVSGSRNRPSVVRGKGLTVQINPVSPTYQPCVHRCVASPLWACLLVPKMETIVPTTG